MLSHKAAPFYEAVWNLRRLHARIEARPDLKTAISDKDRSGIEKHITALRKSLEELEAPGSHAVAGVILDDLSNVSKSTYAKFVERVNSLHQVLKKELSETELFVLHGADSKLFAPKDPLFGDKVDKKFSAARFDIEEAGKCLALGRYTACVFHVMRAAEEAVFVLAKKLRAPVKKRNGERLTWGDLTSRIKTKIDAKPHGDAKDELLKIHMFLNACNRAYRTKTAHPGPKYIEEEARDAYEATSAFMRKMAELV